MVEHAGLSAEGPPRGWHDVFEDTETPVAELEEQFRADVTRAVWLPTNTPQWR